MLYPPTERIMAGLLGVAASNIVFLGSVEYVKTRSCRVVAGYDADPQWTTLYFQICTLLRRKDCSGGGRYTSAQPESIL